MPSLNYHFHIKKYLKPSTFLEVAQVPLTCSTVPLDLFTLDILILLTCVLVSPWVFSSFLPVSSTFLFGVLLFLFKAQLLFLRTLLAILTALPFTVFNPLEPGHTFFGISCSNFQERCVLWPNWQGWCDNFFSGKHFQVFPCNVQFYIYVCTVRKKLNLAILLFFSLLLLISGVQISWNF